MKRALIVVDVQHDFIEGGSLPVTGGTAVAQRIAAHIADHGTDYDLIVATRDDHLPDSLNGGHFAEPGTDPDYSSTWPAHCVQGTHGTELHPDVKRALDETPTFYTEIFKGHDEAAYSGFEGEGIWESTIDSLEGILSYERIDDLDICGLALDYCVLQTVKDARRIEYPVRVFANLTAPVAPNTGLDAIHKMQDMGVEYLSSYDQVVPEVARLTADADQQTRDAVQRVRAEEIANEIANHGSAEPL